ncbi:alpha-L-rhamnosidase C-terminal domain-containing protein, partial [Streptomyces acidiscabies]|uniref:alpha-L-rhamnosidase C-terminal domain-containing protein n=1 Tax=Streptomyces acidiscabies TaxID=42234 RepID=UPI000AED526F
PGDGLDRAQAALLTPYGRAEIAWRLDGEELHVTALVPPNATAQVDLPGPAGAPFDVTAGHHTWTVHLPAPDRPSGPITLDTTLGELMDRPGAMKIFTDTLIRFFPEAAAYIDQSDTESGETTIRDAAAMVPGGPEFLLDLEEQYAAFNAAGASEN